MHRHGGSWQGRSRQGTASHGKAWQVTAGLRGLRCIGQRALTGFGCDGVANFATQAVTSMGAAGSSSTKAQAGRHLKPQAMVGVGGRIEAIVVEPVGEGGGSAAATMGDLQQGAVLRSNYVNPDGVLRVAQDGSGHFRSVQAAIDAVPLPNSKRVVISLAAGVYRQPVYVPKQKNRITIQVWRLFRIWTLFELPHLDH